MWQTHWYFCAGFPILILVLADYTTDWSFHRNWTAYDVEYFFVDQLDRLTEYDDWEDWEEAETTA